MAEKPTSAEAEAVLVTEEQEKLGYWTEKSGEYVLVWHDNNQIALLMDSPDIGDKVQKVVAKREKDLEEVFQKTGWRPPGRQG
ncbi:MAG: hypothetical protein HYY01_02285 [Chloroflexi bacterium]|nr:hypothetical protein [Chloroflexota bacterium]